jgi:hypothetical protein
MKVQLTEKDLGLTIAMLSVIVSTFGSDASLKVHVEEVKHLRNKLRVLLDNAMHESVFGSNEDAPEDTNALH